MRKSFVERIFPYPPSNPILPQHERGPQERHSSSVSPSSPRTPQSGAAQQSQGHSTVSSSTLPLRSASLSVPVINREDSLLPVDRASRSLQRHIQLLLDAQSDGLVAGLGAGHDGLSSTGSLTPTPSLSPTPRGGTGFKAVPIRQPKQEKVSLRGARRGLAKSMDDFAVLKGEELRILDVQVQDREAAVTTAEAFEARRDGLNDQINSIQHEGDSASAQGLRKEAENLDAEIKALEDRLLEMKARHRHILDQASQIESSLESRISSYRSSIALVEKEIKDFLRRPPVVQSLSLDPENGQGIYALKPDRRTLDMAKDQWTREQDALNTKKEDVETERLAFLQGAKLWRETLSRITRFEKRLRAQTNDLARSQLQASTNNSLSPIPTTEFTPASLLIDLDSTITYLTTNLTIAESNNWNLLICCIGAELEAFRQGKALLEQTFQMVSPDTQAGDIENSTHPIISLGPNHNGEHESHKPPNDMFSHYSDNPQSGSNIMPSPGLESNHSLEDTLREFGDSLNPKPSSKAPATAITNDSSTFAQADGTVAFETGNSRSRATGRASQDSKSESEDDDPGPDFFLSHA